MKKIILLFLLLFSLNSFGIIRYHISYVVGRVEYNTIKTDLYKKVNQNDIIEDLKTIRTGKASYVRIISSDDKKFFIYPESTVSFVDQTSSMLYAGEAEFNVGKDYNVKTLALVVGVRGTIFKITSIGNIQKVIVYDGKVEVRDVANTGSFNLERGRKLEWDTTYSFSEAKISNASLEDLEFKIDKLDPKLSYLGVEDQASKSGMDMVTLAQKDKEGENKFVKAEEKKEKEEEVKIERRLEEEIKKEEIKRPDETFEKFKKEKVFNLAIGLGSISKDNYFYKTFFIKPFLKIRKNIKLELFFPFVIDDRKPLYYFSKWGNYDEWNFSSGRDIINDLVLKLSYFELNERSDLLYVRVGELKDIVIGNAFMVDMFDPSISIFDRQIGAEIIIDNGSFGVESFINNVTDPEIIFVNMFIKPFYGVPFIGKFKIGLEIDVDKNPTGDFNNPAYFYIGVNSLLPISSSEFFSVDLLLDLGKQGLYLRKWEERPSVWADGFDFAHFHLFDNYSASLGFSGYLSKYVTYKLYYSYLHSGFVDSYFDKMYYKKNVNDIVYLIEPNKEDEHSARFKLGFFIPNLVKIEGGANIYLIRDEKNIAFINIKTTDFYGFFIDAFYYTLIKDFNFSAYDKNSIFSFGLTYLIAPSAYITFKKFWVYNKDGEKESRVMLATYVSF